MDVNKSIVVSGGIFGAFLLGGIAVGLMTRQPNETRGGAVLRGITFSLEVPTALATLLILGMIIVNRENIQQIVTKAERFIDTFEAKVRSLPQYVRNALGL